MVVVAGGLTVDVADCPCPGNVSLRFTERMPHLRPSA